MVETELQGLNEVIANANISALQGDTVKTRHWIERAEYLNQDLKAIAQDDLEGILGKAFGIAALEQLNLALANIKEYKRVTIDYPRKQCELAHALWAGQAFETALQKISHSTPEYQFIFEQKYRASQRDLIEFTLVKRMNENGLA